ncbi:MAG: response regulator [Pseudomonadota bacterium]
MAATKNYDLGRLNVLIVDDNRHMHDILSNMLRGLGVKTISRCADGAAAFLALKDFAADLVVLDWEVPILDGYDFTRLIRTAHDSPNPFVPIIMLTAHTERRRVIMARDAGVNEYLAKPVSARSLYERIVAVIENPRPFIRSPNYFGPCRRRRADPNYKGPERRAAGPSQPAAAGEARPNAA